MYPDNDSTDAASVDAPSKIIIDVSDFVQDGSRQAALSAWAAFLFMAGPLIIWLAMNAAIAYRLFCWIAKVCG